jgi:hypothetical protein
VAGSLLLPEQSLAGNRVAPSPHDTGTHLLFASGARGGDDALCLAAACGVPPPDARTHAWAAALLAHVAPGRLLLLDTLPDGEARKARGGGGGLRAMQTDAAAAAGPCPFPPLPRGPLLGGASAALLTLCQARGLPARVVLAEGGPEAEPPAAQARAYAAAMRAEAVAAGIQAADAPDGEAAAAAAAAAGVLRSAGPSLAVYA